MSNGPEQVLYLLDGQRRGDREPLTSGLPNSLESSSAGSPSNAGARQSLERVPSGRLLTLVARYRKVPRIYPQAEVKDEWLTRLVGAIEAVCDYTTDKGQDLSDDRMIEVIETLGADVSQLESLLD